VAGRPDGKGSGVDREGHFEAATQKKGRLGPDPDAEGKLDWVGCRKEPAVLREGRGNTKTVRCGRDIDPTLKIGYGKMKSEVSIKKVTKSSSRRGRLKRKGGDEVRKKRLAGKDNLVRREIKLTGATENESKP